MSRSAKLLQKKVTPGRGLLILLLAVSLAVLSSRAWTHGPTAAEQIAVEEKNGRKVPLDVVFADELGNPVALRGLTDKPVILDLAYYTCDRICPQVMAGIAQVLPKLKLTPGKDYRVLTVSFDEYDTPQTARETKKNYLQAIAAPFPADGWRFLTGKRDQIGRLTQAVGFSFRRDGHEFIHPVTLIILAPDGTINRYIYVPNSAYGTSFPVNFSALELQTALAEAGQGKLGAAVKRAFLYCFPHEPKNQAAFFRLLAMSGAATLIAILALFLFLRRRPGKKSSGSEHGSE